MTRNLAGSSQNRNLAVPVGLALLLALGAVAVFPKPVAATPTITQGCTVVDAPMDISSLHYDGVSFGGQLTGTYGFGQPGGVKVNPATGDIVTNVHRYTTSGPANSPNYQDKTDYTTSCATKWTQRTVCSGTTPPVCQINGPFFMPSQQWSFINQASTGTAPSATCTYQKVSANTGFLVSGVPALNVAGTTNCPNLANSAPLVNVVGDGDGYVQSAEEYTIMLYDVFAKVYKDTAFVGVLSAGGRSGGSACDCPVSIMADPQSNSAYVSREIFNSVGTGVAADVLKVDLATLTPGLTQTTQDTTLLLGVQSPVRQMQGTGNEGKLIAIGETHTPSNTVYHVITKSTMAKVQTTLPLPTGIKSDGTGAYGATAWTLAGDNTAFLCGVLGTNSHAGIWQVDPLGGTVNLLLDVAPMGAPVVGGTGIGFVPNWCDFDYHGGFWMRTSDLCTVAGVATNVPCAAYTHFTVSGISQPTPRTPDLTIYPHPDGIAAPRPPPGLVAQVTTSSTTTGATTRVDLRWLLSPDDPNTTIGNFTYFPYGDSLILAGLGDPTTALDGDGQRYFQVTYSGSTSVPGPHSFNVKAQDQFGQQSISSCTATVDTRVPSDINACGTSLVNAPTLAANATSAVGALVAFASTIVGPGSGDLFLFGLILVVIGMAGVFGMVMAFTKNKQGTPAKDAALAASLPSAITGVLIMVLNGLAGLWESWTAITCIALASAAIAGVAVKVMGGK